MINLSGMKKKIMNKGMEGKALTNKKVFIPPSNLSKTRKAKKASAMLPTDQTEWKIIKHLFK